MPSDASLPESEYDTEKTSVLISFQIELDMIVVTVSISNQMKYI